ncbi:MAG TPA: T9SS type A sorting domain-containing protein, partial [Niastella sp.]|nr:T9SS type A sorting domain-containing protein [Niastella sp.]
EPATGAATATGTITLTFTQTEFDNYNAVRGILPALPTGAADATGIANLIVSQYHGTGTAPGNYTGTTVLIDPANANIIWNATQSRWEVTFDVTGFSGFYVQTTSGTLPLKLLSFTAGKVAEMNVLKWATSEEINTDNFEVERNTGNGFVKIGFIKAAGNSGTKKQYAFEDKQPFTGANHYRLKMVDKDANAEYSKIATVQNDGRTGISIYPNPAQSRLFVEGAIIGTGYHIKNTSGQVVTTGQLNTDGINLSRLSTGIYVLVVNGVPFKFFKQ